MSIITKVVEMFHQYLLHVCRTKHFVSSHIKYYSFLATIISNTIFETTTENQHRVLHYANLQTQYGEEIANHLKECRKISRKIVCQKNHRNQ